MKIYTKGGDTGETGLFGGTRVPKDDLRIRVYGTVDELNAVLGVALAGAVGKGAWSPEFRKALARIQSELFQIGAELATPRGKALATAPIGDPETVALEHEIDAMEKKLP